MLKLQAVTNGGSLGASSRYSLFMAVRRLADNRFPAGTPTASLPGLFLTGLLRSLFEGIRPTDKWRLFIFTGFSGGFTTFSNFTRETARFYELDDCRRIPLYPGIGNFTGVLPALDGNDVAKTHLPAA